MPVDTDTQEKVTYFAKKFGDPHLHLAYHLAFPVTFTPDLAYQIWAHFQRDSQGQHLKVPWIAVADVLLSFLCQEVQNETFRMDEQARRYLLEQMKNNDRFGQPRLQELAHFLGHYVRQQLQSQDQYERQAAEVQELQALSILAPEKALHTLAGQLTNTDLSRGQTRRIASLVDQFSSTAELSAADATTAEAFTQLRDYTQVRAQLTDRRADKQQAVNQLRDQFDTVPTIAGQELPGWQMFNTELPEEPIERSKKEPLIEVDKESAEEIGVDKELAEELVDVIANNFTAADLNDLLFDMGIDIEAILGENRLDTSRNLVTTMRDKGQLLELIDAIQGQKPHLDISESGAVPSQPAKSTDSLRTAESKEHINFDIRIYNKQEDTYPVEATHAYHGGAGTGTIQQQFDLNDEEFQDLFLYLQELVAEPEDTKSFGHKLRQLLFPSRVWSLFNTLRQDARRDGKGVRIRLRVDPPELSRLPWEYCYEY